MKRKIIAVFMVMGLLLMTGCSNKAEALHQEVESLKKSQTYVETAELEAMTQMMSETAEPDRVYDVTFLIVPAELSEDELVDTTQIAEVSVVFQPGKKNEARQNEFKDQLEWSVLSSPSLKEIHDRHGHAPMRVGAAMMSWQSRSVEDGASDEWPRYWLLDQTGDAKWDWSGYVPQTAEGYNAEGYVALGDPRDRPDFYRSFEQRLPDGWDGTLQSIEDLFYGQK